MTTNRPPFPAHQAHRLDDATVQALAFAWGYVSEAGYQAGTNPRRWPGTIPTYREVADELHRRGYRTARGLLWTTERLHSVVLGCCLGLSFSEIWRAGYDCAFWERRGRQPKWG